MTKKKKKKTGNGSKSSEDNTTLDVGTEVEWKSQGGGSVTEKQGKVVRVIGKSVVPWKIAEKEFPDHRRMFEGWSVPPSKIGMGYLVEVVTGPKAKPRLYMPHPDNLQKV